MAEWLGGALQKHLQEFESLPNLNCTCGRAVIGARLQGVITGVRIPPCAQVTFLNFLRITIDMEVKKTQCKTERTQEDDSIIVVDKVKFNTLKEAIAEAKKQNAMPGKEYKLVSYKCNVCHKYHIGRNGTLITDKYRGKLKEEKREEKRKLFDENLKNAELKIVGTVDLSKFDVTVKIRKNGTKKITYK